MKRQFNKNLPSVYIDEQGVQRIVCPCGTDIPNLISTSVTDDVKNTNAECAAEFLLTYPNGRALNTPMVKLQFSDGKMVFELPSEEFITGVQNSTIFNDNQSFATASADLLVNLVPSRKSALDNYLKTL